LEEFDFNQQQFKSRPNSPSRFLNPINNNNNQGDHVVLKGSLLLSGKERRKRASLNQSPPLSSQQIYFCGFIFGIFTRIFIISFIPFFLIWLVWIGVGSRPPSSRIGTPSTTTHNKNNNNSPPLSAKKLNSNLQRKESNGKKGWSRLRKVVRRDSHLGIDLVVFVAFLVVLMDCFSIFSL